MGITNNAGALPGLPNLAKRLVLVVHLIAVVIGAVVTFASLFSGDVHGSAQAAGVVTGPLTVAVAVVKLLDTHDKAFAQQCQVGAQFITAHVPEVEALFADLKASVGAVPGLSDRLSQLEAAVKTKVEASAVPAAVSQALGQLATGLAPLASGPTTATSGSSAGTPAGSAQEPAPTA